MFFCTSIASIQTSDLNASVKDAKPLYKYCPHLPLTEKEKKRKE